LKQQILPLNLTKEIIDETSILYREDPIYQVVDDKGKILKKDQELWEQIQKDSRYLTFMDKLDRWVRLLGTVLVKVSFVDPQTGLLVDKNKEGTVQLDMLHGGVYDIRHGASPYYITELLIGFGTKFGGFRERSGTQIIGGSLTGKLPDPSSMGQADIKTRQRIDSPGQLGSVNRIYWSAHSHYVEDEDSKYYETKNPYGIIPAVPFFNQDPAHYYFLPINEPLIYANHATNMRITDLNHIAKFQSFGVPVVSGIERPTSLRQGRPVDDFNVLKGGTAQSRFGGISGFGANGQFRTFDQGLGVTRDGNADANALGFSIGPDTAIAVGEKGDFRFEHPSADITGLIKVIHSITDMVRINHGLRPKYENTLPSSGFALLMEKIGVIENNIRRGKLFKEREEQLFNVIKNLWNVHHNKSGSKRFSEKAKLIITYVNPKFPVDPKTEKEDIMMESKIVETGDRAAIKRMYPHIKEPEIDKLIIQARKDKEERSLFEAELQAKVTEIIGPKEDPKNPGAKHKYLRKSKEAESDKETYIYEDEDGKEKEVKRLDKSKEKLGKPKIDNKAKHAEESSKQPGKNGDPRRKEE